MWSRASRLNSDLLNLKLFSYRWEQVGVELRLDFDPYLACWGDASPTIKALFPLELCPEAINCTQPLL